MQGSAGVRQGELGGVYGDEAHRNRQGTAAEVAVPASKCGGLAAWDGARSGGKGRGRRGLLIAVGGEENPAGDRRSYGDGRDLRRREIFGRRKRKACVTLTQSVGADVWTPHVSD